MGVGAGRVYHVQQDAPTVGLAAFDRILGLLGRVASRSTSASVDAPGLFRFAGPEQVEVGAVDHQDGAAPGFPQWWLQSWMQIYRVGRVAA